MTLKDFIKASGESQAIWAGRLKVGRGYLSELINGNRRPSLTVAVRIERATDGAVPATIWIADEDADAGTGGAAA